MQETILKNGRQYRSHPVLVLVRIRISFESLIRIRITGQIWIRIRTKVKIRSFKGSKLRLGGPWTHTVEAWRLKMEPWKFFSPVVAGSHHFDEKQDPDPDPHKLDPDPH
jgi:hypothetical protein